MPSSHTCSGRQADWCWYHGQVVWCHRTMPYFPFVPRSYIRVLNNFVWRNVVKCMHVLRNRLFFFNYTECLTWSLSAEAGCLFYAPFPWIMDEGAQLRLKAKPLEWSTGCPTITTCSGLQCFFEAILQKDQCNNQCIILHYIRIP